MLLKDFYTTEALHCGRNTTVLEAAELMHRRHIGDLIVVDDLDDNPIPVGLVTDRDIVLKVLGNGRDAAKTRVADIMSMPLVTAADEEDSSAAIARMRSHGVRRLPVTTAGGRLVGIVTLDDLLRMLRTEVDGLLDILTREQDQERRGRR